VLFILRQKFIISRLLSREPSSVPC
jgi:hypothetical protein